MDARRQRKLIDRFRNRGKDASADELRQIIEELNELIAKGDGRKIGWVRLRSLMYSHSGNYEKSYEDYRWVAQNPESLATDHFVAAQRAVAIGKNLEAMSHLHEAERAWQRESGEVDSVVYLLRAYVNYLLEDYESARLDLEMIVGDATWWVPETETRISKTLLLEQVRDELASK